MSGSSGRSPSPSRGGVTEDATKEVDARGEVLLEAAREDGHTDEDGGAEDAESQRHWSEGSSIRRAEAAALEQTRLFEPRQR